MPWGIVVYDAYRTTNVWKFCYAVYLGTNNVPASIYAQTSSPGF